MGAAARVLKNFGASGLRIVAPRCEVHCSESRAFASGAAELLRRAEVFDTLDEALADRELSIGLTGVGGKHHRMDCVGLLPGPLLEGADHLTKCAVVYGREERGMESTELETCDYLWSLPTQQAFPSLNLAQAIGISLAAVAEAERQRGLAGLGTGVMPTARSLMPLAGSPAAEDQPATNHDVTLLMRRLRGLMLRTGWTDDRRLADSVRVVRNLFVRGRITRKEVNLIHGLARQSHFAVDRPELFEHLRGQGDWEGGSGEERGPIDSGETGGGRDPE